MATNDHPPHTLRRAWFSGYNAGDVEVLLAQLSLKETQIRTELDSLRARLEAADAERRELAALLEDAHRRELELKAAAAEAQAQAAQADAAVRREADALLAAARAEAVRTRAEAERDAQHVRRQVDELLQLRETLTRTMRTFIGEYGRIVEGGGAPPEPHPEAKAAPPAVAPEPAQPLFEQAVEVDAGPFYDFESLSAFERALASLPHVADAYVRRFSDDRATIELTLDEPTPLLADIASRLPYALSVEHDDNRIELTLGAPNPA